MFSALNKSPPVPETLSSEGKDFLRCCFQRKPADRPTALLLLEHPFLGNTSSREHSATISGCFEDFSRMKLHVSFTSCLMFNILVFDIDFSFVYRAFISLIVFLSS